MEPLDIYAKIQPLVQKEIDDQVKQFTDDRKYDVAQIPAHSHTGIESETVDFGNLDNRTRFILYRLLAPTTVLTVSSSVGGDFVMPFNGYITSVGATVDTAGTTGTMTVDVKKNATSVLYTKITIASAAKTSRTYTTTTAPVLDTTKINFKTGDIFTFDISTIQTTPAQGLTVFINVKET